MTHYAIKHRLTGAILFEARAESLSVAVGFAVHMNADLRGADLSYADLRGAKLAGADFTGADFTGAKLAGANLAGANFAGANFANADIDELAQQAAQAGPR